MDILGQERYIKALLGDWSEYRWFDPDDIMERNYD